MAVARLLQYSSAHLCGSVLVSERLALTAAHCFDKRDRWGLYSLLFGCVYNSNRFDPNAQQLQVLIKSLSSDYLL